MELFAKIVHGFSVTDYFRKRLYIIILLGFKCASEEIFEPLHVIIITQDEGQTNPKPRKLLR